MDDTWIELHGIRIDLATITIIGRKQSRDGSLRLHLYFQNDPEATPSVELTGADASRLMAAVEPLAKTYGRPLIIDTSADP